MGKDYPVGFSLAYSSAGAFYRPIEDVEFKSILADETRLKIAHNAKYDRNMIKKAGVVIDNLCDPMIAAHLVPGTWELSLRSTLSQYIDKRIADYSQLSKKITDMTLEELTLYSGPHSAYLMDLWPILEAEMDKLNLLHLFWDIEMPLVPVLSDMELNGMAVDLTTLHSLGNYLDDKIGILTTAMDQCSGYSGMNYNSPAQMSDLFYNKLKVTPDWKVGIDGKPSVRAEHIEKIKHEHPVLGLYHQFKRHKTLKNNFVDSLIGKNIDGRVYGSFNQTRTRTGRLSSSDPNLQNIPQRTELGKRIRTAFVAASGCSLLKSDYIQIELVMMAHCSQDPALLSAFREGRDVHTETAIRAFGSKNKRPEAKTLNYQVIFGGGSLINRNRFFVAYPRVAEWIKETNEETRCSQYAKTINGRIRVIDEYVREEDDRKYSGMIGYKLLDHGDRESISTIVQGSSAEVVKIGMRRAWDELKDSGVKFLVQVHDELVLEVPDNILKDVIEVVNRTMRYDELSVPIGISVSVGQNWGEMKEVS